MERASAGIFRWVVQPYLNDVRQAGIEKLVFVSSDTLAPLPFATLFDNRRYLIDDFEVLRSFGKVVAPINQSAYKAKPLRTSYRWPKPLLKKPTMPTW